MIYSFEGKKPQVGKNVFIAPNATIIGDVILEDNVNIWFGAVLRGDISQIHIQENSNIQDNTVIHTDVVCGTIVGRNCVVGHGAILHSCKIGNGSLIGMGAILLNSSEIGEESVVGAGSLVVERKIFERRSQILGSPARFIREITDAEVLAIEDNVKRYQQRAIQYRKNLGE